MKKIIFFINRLRGGEKQENNLLASAGNTPDSKNIFSQPIYAITSSHTLEDGQYEAYEVLKKYYVEAAEISLVKTIDGDIRYYVKEPEISDKSKEVAYSILLDLLYLDNIDDYAIIEVLKKRKLFDIAKDRLEEVKYIVNRMLSGYGKIYPIMKDPYVEEIAAEGPGEPVSIFHRDVGIGWITSNIILSEEELNTLVMNLARKSGRHLSRLVPLAEGITKNGHRIAVTYLNEVSPKGSSFVIRKFLPKPLTMIDLIKNETLSPLMASYFWLLVENFAFIFIIGGMASGKSVTADSTLLLRIDDEIHAMSFKELWEFLENKCAKVISIGTMRAIDIKNCSSKIEVISLSRKGYVQWVSPRFLIRHKIHEPIYKVVLENGLEIRLTKDHSLIVYNENKDRFEKVKPSAGIVGYKVPVLSCKLGRYHECEEVSTGLSIEEIMPRNFCSNITRRREVVYFCSGNAEDVRRAYYAFLLLGLEPSFDEEKCVRATLQRNPDLITLLCKKSANHCMCISSPRMVRILDVREQEYSGYVYDIEVPFTNVFEANGVFVHNTTLLQAILSLIPSSYRIVTIEDTPELVLANKRWDRLVTRYEFLGANKSSYYDIDLETIAKFALRRRAEYIVIGEVRGREARVLAQAAATGQGSACTFHADTVSSALVRLMSKPISLKQAFIQLIWTIARMQQVKQGLSLKRKVVEVIEIKPLADAYQLIPVFRWDPVEQRFMPDSPDSIYENSYRLQQIAASKGWSRNIILEELKRRQEFLEKILEKSRVDHREFAMLIDRYYKNYMGLR